MITHINKKKSIATGWLVYNRSRWDIVFDFIGGIMVLGIIPIPLVPFFLLDHGIHIKWFVITPVIIFVLYFIYRKVVELRLIKVHTGMHAEQAIPLLQEFFKNRAYTEDEYEEHVVFFEKKQTFRDRLVIIFIENSCLYFCVLKFGPNTTEPALFSHFLLKRDLVKMFKKASPQ